ncbi:MAG: hypothetical protein Q6351_004960 [Candidatus Njordarchaeum guaymaensis]
MSSILRYFQKKIFGFYLRRLVKKWCEETDGWKRNDWINYLKDRFEEKKKTRWTRLMFPKLMEYTYEELDSYPVTYNWPIYPSAFPVAAQWSSTGTVKRKLIKVTKEDILDIVKGVGRLGYKYIMQGIIEKELLLYWREESASGSLMKLQKIWSAKEAYLISPLNIKEEIPKVKKNAPYDMISASTPASLVLLLKNIDFPILKEGGIIVSSGDLLSPSLKKLISEMIEGLGTSNFRIFDFYGSSETIMIAGGFVGMQEQKLTYFPDLVSLRIQRADGSITDIFRAKRGDVGTVIPTILMTLVVPNYNLGDVIEVVNPGDGKHLPEIRVLGREIIKIDQDHPELGKIRGFSGAIVKFLGVPVSTYALDELFTNKLKTRYLVVLEMENNEGKVTIYTNRNINLNFVLEQLKNSRNLYNLYLLYKSGLLEFKLVHNNKVVKHYEELFLEKEGTKPFMPRIIVNAKI